MGVIHLKFSIGYLPLAMMHLCGPLVGGVKHWLVHDKTTSLPIGLNCCDVNVDWPGYLWCHKCYKKARSHVQIPRVSLDLVQTYNPHLWYTNPQVNYNLTFDVDFSFCWLSFLLYCYHVDHLQWEPIHKGHVKLSWSKLVISGTEHLVEL